MGIFDFLKIKSEGAVPQPPKEENYDVKPQDSEVETRDEEMSPDDGNQDTGTLMEAKDWLGMPPYLKTKVHGQTATLVDMLIELNKKMHFKSADEALGTLFKYMENIRTDGDKRAIRCSIYGLCKCAQYGFLNGHLDIDALKSALDNVGYYVGLEAVYAVYNDYIMEKTIRLVEILNAYRQYTNPQDLITDFVKIVTSSREFSYWRKENGDSYFGFGWIPVSYFKEYVKGFWGEFAPDGVMDNALFRNIMIERHAEEVKKNGLDAVVQRDYIPGCYGYYPSGVGPVYQPKYEWGMYHFRFDFDSWKFEKSCGDANTGYDMPSELEISMILEFLRDELLRDINRYSYGYMEDNIRLMNACGEIYYGGASGYTIPTYDYSLPIYRGGDLRRAFFKSKKEKIKFIIKVKADIAKRVDPDSIPPEYLNTNRLRREIMELAESEEERKQIKEEFKFLFEKK